MNFIIENTQVYGLDRAIKASGNPMRTRFNRDIVSDKDILRAEKLGIPFVNKESDAFFAEAEKEYKDRKPQYLEIVKSIITSIVGMCGDLTASLIKRNYGIKDFGNLIPGHGGIMDRFDSVLITVPILLVIAEIAAYYSIF